ncbi:hypothetical protein [Coleofasciculus sp. H7-2]
MKDDRTAEGAENAEEGSSGEFGCLGIVRLCPDRGGDRFIHDLLRVS